MEIYLAFASGMFVGAFVMAIVAVWIVAQAQQLPPTARTDAQNKTTGWGGRRPLRELVPEQNLRQVTDKHALNQAAAMRRESCTCDPQSMLLPDCRTHQCGYHSTACPLFRAAGLPLVEG